MPGTLLSAREPSGRRAPRPSVGAGNYPVGMDAALILPLVSCALTLIALVMLGAILHRQGTDRATLRDIDRRTRAGARAASTATPDAAPARATNAAGAAGADDVEPTESDAAAEGAHLPHIAVVLNPSKHADPERYREYLHQSIERFEGSQARFYETTREDPGYGQALQAVRDGADLVIAAGGDGTVRTVAAALAGTDTTMAVLPVGTGNLLARNLDVPLEDVAGALKVALHGRDRMADVGWMRSGRTPQELEIARPEIFLVMAGFGADAEIMGATSPTMKRRIGWMAYVVAGAKYVAGRSQDVHITLPGGTRRTMLARTVLIGNVGKLPGGIVLMPDAEIDNGRLEVLALGWRGAAGLGQIIAQLVTPRMRVQTPRTTTVERFLVSRVEIVSGKPLPVQYDGDPDREATHITAWVEPASLRLRVPQDA